MGKIRLFVSHAHSDRDIAVALVKAIEAAMVVPPEHLLCTSHPDEKYREPEGVDLTQYLRDHLTQSACVLGLLTPSSIESSWCLFELGGAWLLAKQTYCLLAGGLSPDSLPAALKGAEAVQLTEPEEIRTVLAKIRQALVWDERINGSAAKEIDELVNLVREFKWAPPSGQLDSRA
jgi:hypothetical protein